MLVFFGALGYLMKKLEIPAAALLLAFILGNNIEFTMIQTLSLSPAGLLYLFQRPISGTLMTLCLAILGFSIYTAVKKKRGQLAADAEV